MRTPSRKMPSIPERKLPWWRWPILGIILVTFCYWMYCNPIVLIFFVGLVAAFWFQSISMTGYRRRLAVARINESICVFARSFDRRTDTWILRAVYEELSKYNSVDGRPVPVRRTDRCLVNLKIDPEDLNDIANDIAARAQRSMDGAEKNPFYNKCMTVGDIVAFFEHQPMITDAEPDGSANGSRPLPA